MGPIKQPKLANLAGESGVRQTTGAERLELSGPPGFLGSPKLGRALLAVPGSCP